MDGAWPGGTQWIEKHKYQLPVWSAGCLRELCSSIHSIPYMHTYTHAPSFTIGPMSKLLPVYPRFIGPNCKDSSPPRPPIRSLRRDMAQMIARALEYASTSNVRLENGDTFRLVLCPSFHTTAQLKPLQPPAVGRTRTRGSRSGASN